MNDDRFWEMIETAWKSVGGKVKMRQKLAAGKASEDVAYAIEELSDEVLDDLGQHLDELSQADLLAFDRILERKLYDIDRAEVQERTDGSDDGFLYARGFIVVCGKGYYDAVNAKPSIAFPELECEALCYLPLHRYEDKFGPLPASEISRESQSNEAGWR